MKSPLRLVVFPLLLWVSCAPQHPKDMAAVEEIRTQIESIRESNETQPETGAYTLENLILVRRAEENEPDSLQRLRLTILRHTLTSGILLKPSVSASVIRSVAEANDVSSVRGMLEEVQGFSFAETRALAESVLTRTDSLARTLGGEEVPAFPRDIERYLDPATRRRVALATFQQLGFKPDSGTQDPGALAPAFTGQADRFAEEFAKMGRSVYRASITERALEFRRFGEATVAEVFGELIGGLTANPAWMRQHLGMPVPALKTYARHAALLRLALIHDLAEKIVTTYGSVISDEPEFWERTLRTDPDFQYVRNFRSRLIAARFDAWLRGRYGVNWYENPDAGVMVRELWNQGGRLNSVGMLQRSGDTTLRADAWIRTVNELLLLSSR